MQPIVVFLFYSIPSFFIKKRKKESDKYIVSNNNVIKKIKLDNVILEPEVTEGFSDDK